MEPIEHHSSKDIEHSDNHHNHGVAKPFLGRCMSKNTPIGAELHQAKIS
jgi:hypothetical protein